MLAVITPYMKECSRGWVYIVNLHISVVCLPAERKCLTVNWREEQRRTSCVSALLQNGVVHRDLKLENILLDQDLNVKVRSIKHIQTHMTFQERNEIKNV